LITASSWVFWRGLRRWLTKNPLDNIPGPPKASWLAGTPLSRLYIIPQSSSLPFAGHFEQLWDVNDGWAFHKGIANRCKSRVARTCLETG
jgi:hypothetical protein